MGFPEIYTVFFSTESGEHIHSMDVGAVSLSEKIAKAEDWYGRLQMGNDGLHNHMRADRQLLVFDELRKLKPCHSTHFEYSDSTWVSIGRADGIELSKVNKAVEKYKKEKSRKHKKQKP